MEANNYLSLARLGVGSRNLVCITGIGSFQFRKRILLDRSVAIRLCLVCQSPFGKWHVCQRRRLDLPPGLLLYLDLDFPDLCHDLYGNGVSDGKACVACVYSPLAHRILQTLTQVQSTFVFFWQVYSQTRRMQPQWGNVVGTRQESPSCRYASCHIRWGLLLDYNLSERYSHDTSTMELHFRVLPAQHPHCDILSSARILELFHLHETKILLL